MKYCSTRSSASSVSSAQAIIQGLSLEGGLFVPESFPSVSLETIGKMVSMDYAARAKEILSLYLTDYTDEELSDCVRDAYTEGRFAGEPAPLKKVGENYVLELWHGPTHAFKDMALQMLPHLMTRAMKKVGVKEQVFILVATSGDTGKAALEGFCDVPGTNVGVFFPVDGVSPAQKLQMMTQEGQNTCVCSVYGNFDDAQTGVKTIFNDTEFAKELKDKGYVLSSANSINWGRLVPQVAYYFSAYCDLIRQGALNLGEPADFCVPTGNFGNILAAYYAKRMGLPVGKLICASNQNNVLFDFICGGTYNANRTFYKTASPSMDILVSSNLERLLYELCGKNPETISKWMQALKSGGQYAVDEKTLEALHESFSAAWTDDKTAFEAIKNVQEKENYLLDPHTSVAWVAAEDYRKAGGKNPMVVVSTASPYKFSRSVLTALTGDPHEDLDEFACADKLEKLSSLKMPETLRELKQKPLRHKDVVNPDQMLEEVRGWAK